MNRTSLPRATGLLATLVALLLLATAYAQTRAEWTISSIADAAYLDAFAISPTSLAAGDVTISYDCRLDPPIAILVTQPPYAVPSTVEVLTRIDDEDPRRATWTSETADGTVFFYPRGAAQTQLLEAAWRRGDTFAVRFFLRSGLEDSAQPTFQFDVSRFDQARAEIGCGAAPPPAAAPEAPASPATPSTPAPSNPSPPATGAGEVLTWELDGEGPDALMVAERGGVGLGFFCTVEGNPPVIGLFDAGPGAVTSVTIGSGSPLQVESVAEGVYVLLANESPNVATQQVIVTIGLDGVEGRMTGAVARVGVVVTRDDGTQEERFAVSGGDDFFDTFDALPCTPDDGASSGSSSGAGTPAPSPAPTPAPAPPTTGSSDVVSWTLVEDSGRPFMSANAPGVALGILCDTAGDFPLAVVGLSNDNPLVGRSFRVRLGGSEPLDAVDLGGGAYQLSRGGVAAIGATQALIASFEGAAFDVVAVFDDGSEQLLLRAAGGEDFGQAWDQVPCTGAEPDAGTPPAPSSPAADAGSAWRLDERSEVLFHPVDGREFGFVCGISESGEPLVYLFLPDVNVPTSDNIAEFSFARTNGSVGTSTWQFFDFEDGWFVTELTATDDIIFQLLPNEGSTAWHDVVVSLPGQGPLMTVDGSDRIAELYGQLTCAQ